MYICMQGELPYAMHVMQQTLVRLCFSLIWLQCLTLVLCFAFYIQSGRHWLMARCGCHYCHMSPPPMMILLSFRLPLSAGYRASSEWRSSLSSMQFPLCCVMQKWSRCGFPPLQKMGPHLGAQLEARSSLGH